MGPRILVVDDEPGLRTYMRTLLETDNYRVETANNGTEALTRMQQSPSPDVILLDVLMPDGSGLDVLARIKSMRPQQKVIMISCISETRKVAQAMRLGALDYLTKPFQKAELEEVLRLCVGQQSESSPDCADPVDDAFLEVAEGVFFYGSSPAMRKIRHQAQLVAKVDIPVLILGESGTGKEVLSHLIHKFSPRGSRMFMKVNCAAVPADLLESELFGYEAGAFTGATKAKPGKFELCNHGTILLDEIGEMPPSLQAKLLHVLQDGTFSRLGSRSSVKVDVRVLAATNINMQEAIANKTFREDLYYRLNGFSIMLPPLRERKEEIPMLLKHFMGRTAERYGREPLPFSRRMLDACANYSWPGNLREVENFIKRYLVLGDEQVINDFVSESAARPVASDYSVAGLKNLVRNIKGNAEAQAIAEALERHRWNRKRVAEELRISYKALLYKIRQYDIQQQQVRA